MNYIELNELLFVFIRNICVIRVPMCHPCSKARQSSLAIAPPLDGSSQDETVHRKCLNGLRHDQSQLQSNFKFFANFFKNYILIGFLCFIYDHWYASTKFINIS